MFASLVLALAATAELTAALSVPKRQVMLGADDIILYSTSGRVEIMKRWEYAPLNGKIETFAPLNTTGVPHVQGSKRSAPPMTAEEIRKRGSETIVIQNPAIDFLGWDVVMSSVVKGSSGSDTVSVTEGYSISNTLTVGMTSSISLIEDLLTTTLSIDYSKSWTSAYNAAYTFTVDKGKYGAVVSNPKTHRESGTIFSGRIGSEGTTTTYQADSFSSKAYGSLSWVDGVIQLCQSETYPLPRCIGEGTL